MIQRIRMIADREGAHDHYHIHTYVAGEVYSLDRTDPPISQDLLDGFVASGHAIEVDANGNPVATPGSKRQTKPAGPSATKGDDAAPNADAAPVAEAADGAAPESTPALETSGSGAPEAPTE